MIRIVLAAAVLSLAAAQPASALRFMNGGGANGISLNGGGNNGTFLNGGGSNGIARNGGFGNGFTVNGVQPGASVADMQQGITLPSGVRLDLAR